MLKIILIFMFLFYVRPHEFIGGVSMLRPVALALAAGILALLMRGLPFNLKEMFKTPHDWFLLAFLFHLIDNAPPSVDAFDDLKNRIVLYLMLVHGLTTIKNMEVFCRWWLTMIGCVAWLAWLSTIGLDFTGAQQISRIYDNRLSLGTWIFQNPNALGHGIAPFFPMAYQLWFWRSSMTSRAGFIALCPVPFHALLLTESKGGLLAAFGSLIGGFSLGRKKWIQITIMVVAINAVGILAIFMPRMGILGGGLKGVKDSDEGIYGRWASYNWGLAMMENTEHGVGYKQFVMRHYNDEPELGLKPSHSSYSEVGAELGARGLFLWLGCLYCALRTLLLANCRTVEEERIRRALLAMLFAYLLSGWMTGIPYHVMFFLIVGGAGAFHRVMLERDAFELTGERLIVGGRQLTDEEEVPDEEPLKVDEEDPHQGVRIPDFRSWSGNPWTGLIRGHVENGESFGNTLRMQWGRLSAIDLVMVYAFYKVILEIWTWIVENL